MFANKLSRMAVVALLVAFFSLPAYAGVTQVVRPNGDVVEENIFAFGSHAPGYAAAGLTDTLVSADTVTSSNSFNAYVFGVDNILVSWTTTSINNQDSVFLRTQVSATGETWETATDVDTSVAAGTRQKTLTAANYSGWPMVRVVVAQQNGASDPAATDTVAVKVKMKTLFKSR